ncbi:hypothetical protein FA95DRAFT_1563448 [Auriscalpium vulgare]|uniref:Uncharacterized protein n=1 Tax=Auriscalpium vulgare TaxID=40419 RepID=A0ACB8RGQ5_9AGAM|nr:hypothetical protein FA95DRAFT_1563448 [Auriscalpium vulgare]
MRHQAFVVARVRPHGDATLPPKYRCIAAFHHQWCYGSLPLRAALRFLALLAEKDNAQLVAAEVAALHGLYGRWGEAPEMVKVPAPIVAFLLATSWSLELESKESPYASGVSFDNGVLDAEMGTYDGDNDDGITVIDVTDPLRPAYCFNDVGGLPLSAVEYVGRYYKLPDDATSENPSDGNKPSPDDKQAISEGKPSSMDEEAKADERAVSDEEENNADDTKASSDEQKPSSAVRDEGDSDSDNDSEHSEDDAIDDGAGAKNRWPPDLPSLVTALKDVDMVTIEMLHEAWPTEYEEALQLAHADAPPAPANADPTAAPLPSMASMALTKALAHSLETGDTDALEDWMWQPEMLAAARAQLRQMAPFPDTGIALLNSILAKDTAEHGVLDLSGFALSSDQIAQVVAERVVDEVDLSNNPVVDVAAVKHVLTASPRLRRLVLLGCPAISEDAIVSMLNAEPTLFYHIGALLHPALLSWKRDLRRKPPYTSALTFVFHDEQRVHAYARPYYTPAGLVHALTTLFSALCADDPFLPYAVAQSALVPHSLLAAAPPRAGQSWRGRSTALLPRFSLRVLNGEGWAFFFKMSRMGFGDNAYGFARFFADAQAGAPVSDVGEAALKDPATHAPIGEVLGLRAFLERLVAEGRPAAAEEDVEVLEGHISALGGEKYRLRLMQAEDLENFRAARFVSFS